MNKLVYFDEALSIDPKAWEKLSNDWKNNSSKAYNVKWTQVPIYGKSEDKSK